MYQFPETLISARQFYADIGYETFPLAPGAKSPPLINGWNKINLEGVWEDTPANANVALRCGGRNQLAVLDCDEKNSLGTFDNIIRYLQGLGLNPTSFPIVRTASGKGRHIYMALEEHITGSYATFNPQFGTGEFRFGTGAYVVAPPSQVDGCSYEVISGDFSHLPVVSVQDITPLLNHWETNTTSEYAGPKISRYAKRLLNGVCVDLYPSRSEMEMALICSLINTGWDYSGICELFNKFPCGGKFQEKLHDSKGQAYHYLKTSFDNAVKFTNSNISDGRRIALHAIDWALSNTWNGRTGAYDRDVFLAHASIAEECGKVVYHASVRRLAESANITSVSAYRATKRLIEQGLIQLEEPSVANCAAKYSLVNSVTLPQLKNVGKCYTTCEHDVFSYFGLGKSAKLIWEALGDVPATLEELVELTGRTRPTVKKWLLRMSKISDVINQTDIQMVYEYNGKWFRNENVDLDLIAEVLGVQGKMEERRRKHEKEQRLHDRIFRKNKYI